MSLADITEAECSVIGCTQGHYARGFCSAHYQAARRQGGFGPQPDRSVRFMGKVRHVEGGCWLWVGADNGRGYGKFWDGEASIYAHRWSYEHFVGQIPDGLTIDHECHNRDETCAGGPACPHRRCVNPEHLRAVSLGENSSASPNSWAAKTHCPQGHEYDDENTYVSPKGDRRCRECDRHAQRERYHARSR